MQFASIGDNLSIFPLVSKLLKTGNQEGRHPLAQKKQEPSKPKYFEDFFYMDVDDVKQLTTFEALYLPIGEVLMVRSANVPMMGDHFAVVSGPIENKEHGVRPQTISIATSPNGYSMLDLFHSKNGAVLLQLKPHARDRFHEFHNAKVVGREIHCLISKTN